jgi:hypothetical protein
MPSKSRTKGSRRKAPSATPVVEVAQVVETAPVEATPVVEAAPVEATPVPATPSSKRQKGGSRRRAPKQVATSTPVSETVTEAPTETEQVTEAFTETATASETQSGRRTRSFKVLLPNSSEYEGRFTGLTPYQAANKALSKYYRETNKPKKEIQFSIRESTRGSKRSVYTYNGRREKLKIPVEYSIKDGRTIVKHYKNRLIKVKKSELTEAAVVSAPASA